MKINTKRIILVISEWSVEIIYKKVFLMEKSFDEFVNQFDKNYYEDLANSLTKSFTENSNAIPIKDLATYSVTMSMQITLHYLREYHEWLHSNENQSSDNQ